MMPDPLPIERRCVCGALVRYSRYGVRKVRILAWHGLDHHTTPDDNFAAEDIARWLTRCSYAEVRK